MSTMSLRDAFLAQHRRYPAVWGDELGFVPEVERGRMEGLGEMRRALTPQVKAVADQLAGLVPTPDDAAALRQRCPTDVGALPMLGAAYHETGDERYAQAARARYLDLLRTRATRAQFSWDDLAHGIYAFLGALHIFLRSPAFDEALTEKIVAAACDQLRWLSAEIHPARNLRNTSATALLCNSLRLAFLPEAQTWLEQGARVMSDAFFRQIAPDGSHLEAVPHYHYCTMGDLLRAFRLARCVPELKMPAPAERVAAMFDYLAAATGPTGWVTGIHDGPCEPAVGLHGQGVADILRERAAFRQALGLPARPLPTVQRFPQANQIFLRDDWTPEATWLSFDAAPCWSYHWHPARNAIQLRAFGRMFLVDPGRFSYTDRTWGGLAMPTRSHNTLNLNGWNQAETEAVLRHQTAPGYEVVTGLYRGGYWPGRPWDSKGEGLYAEHHRTLLWIKERCLVVIDHLLCQSEAERKPDVESNWQFGEGPLTVDAARGLAYTGFDDANVLMLFAFQPADAAWSVHEGEREPLRGWLPRKFESVYVPAPQLTLTLPRRDPWNTDLVTVLVPYRGTARPALTVARTVDPEHTTRQYDPGYGMVSLRWGDGTRDDLLWTRRLETALDVREGMTTDAGLVHLRRAADGRVTGGLAVEATYLDPYAPQRRADRETFAW